MEPNGWNDYLKSRSDATLSHLGNGESSDEDDASDSGKLGGELGFAGFDCGDRFGLGGDIGVVIGSVVGIVSIGLAVSAGGLDGHGVDEIDVVGSILSGVDLLDSADLDDGLVVDTGSLDLVTGSECGLDLGGTGSGSGDVNLDLSLGGDGEVESLVRLAQ